MNDNFKAITAMILAVLCVTIMSVQAKLIGIEYHPVQIAFARAIVVIILLTPIIHKLGGFNFLKTRKVVSTQFMILVEELSTVQLQI